MASTTEQWTIGQEVIVAPRTWPGINKPGGHGKIVKIHYSSLGVVDGLDVKYTLVNKIDTNLESDLVTPHVELDRGRRSRMPRDILTVTPPAAKKKVSKSNKEAVGKVEKKPKNPTKAAAATKKTKENIPPAAEVAPKKKRVKKNDPVPSASMKTKKGKVASNAANKKMQSDNQVKEESTPTEPNVPRLVVTKPVDSSIAVSPLASCTGNNSNNKKSKFRSILPTSAKKQAKSTNNNTSRPAVAAAAAASTNANQGKLKRSYEDNLQEGRCFIDTLVGTGTTTTAAVAKAPAVAAPRVKTDDERLEETRRQQFGQLFSAAMRNTGEIPVDDFAQVINSSAKSTPGCKEFSAEKIQDYINQLCADGKAMESDGVYYEL